MRVLLIEDEPTTAKSIELMLGTEGFNVYTTDLGEEGLDLGKLYDYDIILLDLNLPDMPGFEVLRSLRVSKVKTPILILSGLAGIEDKVCGLGYGADDYMTKPFRFEELLARIRLRLRTDPTAPTTEITVGALRLDMRTRTITTGDRTVELSAREFSLAETFMEHPDQILSREQLLSRVWGYDYDPGTNIVDVYVANLRRKLGHDVIETRRGAGYRLRSIPTSRKR
jgi:DNA-binding response OmpR family regulator